MHTIAQDDDPLLRAIGTDLAALLALSDERDAWLARLAAAEQAAYLRGCWTGYDRGWRDEQAEDAARQRIVADHVVSTAGTPAYRELLIRRWAPPKWRGKIPDGIDTHGARLWLAHQPRRGDYRPGPAAQARIDASWNQT